MEMVWLDEVLSEGVIPDDAPADVEVAPAADVDEVNRLLRKRRALLEKQKGYDAMRDHEVAKITEWHFEVTGVIEAALSRIDRALDGWARAEFEQSKTKTHNLPFGTIRIRPGSGRVELTDDDAGDLIAVEPKLEALVRVKAEVAKKEITSRCDAGKKVSEAESHVDYECVLRRVDTSTGEVEQIVVPGVVFRRPIEGVLGMNVTVQQ